MLVSLPCRWARTMPEGGPIMRQAAALSVFSWWCAGAVFALAAPAPAAPAGAAAAAGSAAGHGSVVTSGAAAASGAPGAPASNAAALLARAKEAAGGKAWDAI